MTYDEMVAYALTLPDTEEGTSYGTPAVKRQGRLMFRLKEDGETVVFKMPWDLHDLLLAESPDVFFKTTHYEDYPSLLAKEGELPMETAHRVIHAAWEDAPFPARRMKP